MGTTLTGKRVQNTYDSLLKITDNDNLTGVPKRITSGLGTDSPIFLSTDKIGIGMSPTVQFQTSGDAEIGNDLVVGGDLTVNGTTTFIDSTIVEIGDNMIELAKDNTANTKDIGWYGTINSGGEKYVGVFYDASTGIVTPEFHIGLGSTEPGNTATWTTKGKLIIGNIDSTGVDITGNLSVTGTIADSDGDVGTSGQVLSSTGSGTNWIDSGSSETAERIEIQVKNVHTGSLAKGTVVHASPTSSPPSGNVIEVVRASYDDSTMMPAIGILNETIASGSEGSAVMMGSLSGINTSSFSAGQELYVGSLGALTNSKPAASHQFVQKIAIVIKVHATNGSIKIFGAGRVNDVPNKIDRDIQADGDIRFLDTRELQFGTDNDLNFKHNGSNATINNKTGQLNIYQLQDDGDIKFFCDDGAGGTENYFQIDGGEQRIKVFNEMRFSDSVELRLGTGSDLRIYHDATDSYIVNSTGNLEIRNNQNDGDINFRSDNGSGGLTTYFAQDGGLVKNRFYKNAYFTDNVKAEFGSSSDLEIYHDGSNSYIKDGGSGNLLITSDGASVQINKGTTENMAEFFTDGAVKLYYDSAKKFETTSSGVTVTGNTTTTGHYFADTHFRSTDTAAALSTTGAGIVYLRPNGYNSTTGQFTLDNSGNGTFAGSITTGRNINLSSTDYAYIQGTHTSAADGEYVMRVFGYGDSNFYGSFDILRHDENDGEIRLRTKIAGTNTNVLSIVDGNSTFAGDITSGGITASGNSSITGDTTSPHSDNAFIVYRGSDSSTALRVQNSGEVVVQNNYLYASGSGTSLYVQNGAVMRGNISNDSGNVTVADNLDVTGDVTINGSHLTLANGTTSAQSTDYLYIGGSNLASADAAIYIGNQGAGGGYGYRIYYSGVGTGNNNKLILKSENLGSEVDMLTFTADGNATFSNDITMLGYINTRLCP
jgi:hypothetical protein